VREYFNVMINFFVCVNIKWRFILCCGRANNWKLCYKFKYWQYIIWLIIYLQIF